MMQTDGIDLVSTVVYTGTMKTKQCQMCKATKPVEQFFKAKQNKDGYFSYCKPCKVDANRRSDNKRLSENREKFLNQRKNWHLKGAYGISMADFTRMLKEQNGVCAICLKDEKQHFRVLSVDHCHTTKKVRGLLCHNCNRAIGFLEDNVENLSRAIAYLSK